MIKITFIIVFTVGLIAFASRYIVSTSGFMQEGIMESIQSCKYDEDCIWTPTGCCGCEDGGGEIVINKDKESFYKLFIKSICFGEQTCSGENMCHAEEIFCDKTCKFGERTVTKPLLAP
jgi:hypothetical protein